MSSRVVGVDIGGTKVLGVVVDPARPERVLASARVETPRGEAAVIDAIAYVVGEVSSEVDHPVGVGVAGLVDRDGVVWTSPNLPGIEQFDFRAELAACLGRRVVVDNDADAAALAEATLGVDGIRGDALFIALGTGVGGALVIDGTVRRGEHGFAGEFGHMIVDPGGVRCVCGRAGCWERYASGSALERMAAEHRLAGPWPSSDEIITAEQVIGAASEGVAGALAVLDEFSDWIGLGIANLVTAFDPGRVILGGGVLDAGDVLLDRIRDSVTRSLFGAEHRSELEVVPATLGSMAGAIGAALLAGRADPRGWA